MEFIIILIYTIGAILSYGLSFAYFQKEFPTIAERCYLADMLFSIILSTIGWYVMIAVLLTSPSGLKHGFKFK